MDTNELLIKLGMLVSVLFVGLFSSFLPFRLPPSEKTERILSISNALAGGVFLAAGLLHMIPDSIESLEDLSDSLNGFPIAESFTCLGFLLTLFLERVLIDGHDSLIVAACEPDIQINPQIKPSNQETTEEKRSSLFDFDITSKLLAGEREEREAEQAINQKELQKKFRSITKSRPTSLRIEDNDFEAYQRNLYEASDSRSMQSEIEDQYSTYTVPNTPNFQKRRTDIEEGDNTGGRKRGETTSIGDGIQAVRVKYYSRLYARGIKLGLEIASKMQEHQQQHRYQDLHHPGDGHKHGDSSINYEESRQERPLYPSYTDIGQTQSEMKTPFTISEEKEKTGRTGGSATQSFITIPVAEEEEETSNGEYYTVYLLVLVLGVHSFISGLALGSEDLDGALLILITILAHKWAAAFSLGVSLIKSGVKWSLSWKLCCLFSSTTPLGIAIGIALENVIDGDTQDVVTGILIALSGGTFLYISIVGNMVEEFSGAETPDKWKKFFAMIFGLLVMASIAIVE